jgi:undecaprenyl-diphosphatase
VPLLRLFTNIVFFKGDRTSQRLCINLVVATLPIVIVGLAYGEAIKAALFNVHTVAIALIVGGLIILWVEKRQRSSIDHPITSSHPTHAGASVHNIAFKQALMLGLLQCLALIPGTSRSGATIIGGLCLGMSRKAAAEFSFFLGIPVLMGAGMLDLFQQRHIISLQPDGLVLLTGIVVAFLSALLVIRVFIQYVSKHDFTVFAWYRIVFGLAVLISAQYINW